MAILPDGPDADADADRERSHIAVIDARTFGLGTPVDVAGSRSETDAPSPDPAAPQTLNFALGLARLLRPPHILDDCWTATPRPGALPHLLNLEPFCTVKHRAEGEHERATDHAPHSLEQAAGRTSHSIFCLLPLLLAKGSGLIFTLRRITAVVHVCHSIGSSLPRSNISNAPTVPSKT